MTRFGVILNYNGRWVDTKYIDGQVKSTVVSENVTYEELVHMILQRLGFDARNCEIKVFYQYKTNLGLCNMMEICDNDDVSTWVCESLSVRPNKIPLYINTGRKFSRCEIASNHDATIRLPGFTIEIKSSRFGSPSNHAAAIKPTPPSQFEKYDGNFDTFNAHGASSDVDCHRKVRKRNDHDIIVRANSTMLRSWNEMPHDILVSILERVPWFHYGFSVCNSCQSWLMAFLDVVTPNNAMDLRFIDSVVEFDSRRCLVDFLLIVFKWRSQRYWKELYLPKRILSQQLLTWIAKRAPLLEYLNVPKGFGYAAEGPRDLCIPGVIPYCKNLRAVHLGPNCLEALSMHCQFITELSLYKLIDDVAASHIAGSFPHLKRLLIPSIFLSYGALETILNSHKNLERLDTRHSCCIPQDDIITNKFYLKNVAWDEQVINEMAAGVELHLQCARKHCERCSRLYNN